MAVISINLLGFEAKKHQSQDLAARIKNFDRVWLTVAGMVAFSTVVSIVGSQYLGTKLAQAQAEQASWEQQSKDLDEKLKGLTNLEHEKDNLIKEKNVLTRVTSTTFFWSRLLDEVRNKMPSNLWVLDMKTSGGAEGQTQDTLVVEAQSLTYQSIAVFMLNLQDSPYFQSVTLSKISEQEIKSESTAKGAKGQILRDFELTCKLNTGILPVATPPPNNKDEADVARSKKFFEAIQK